MPAGANLLLCQVWDYNYDTADGGGGDDDIGGAVPSGTMLYDNVEIRIQSNKPTQAIREQGILGIDTFVGMIRNYTLDVENNNELLITAPASSHYYNKRFRIMGDPQRTSTGATDSRNYLLVNLQRIERGRTIQ